MDLAAWVDAVATLRTSPGAHRQAHLARLEGMPLAKRAVAIRVNGGVLATGLTIVENDCAGLFDIITRDDAADPCGVVPPPLPRDIDRHAESCRRQHERKRRRQVCAGNAFDHQTGASIADIH